MDVMISYLEAIIVSVLILVCCCWSWIMIHRQLRPEVGAKKSGASQSVLPTNWPIFGMLPVYFKHKHHLHDSMTQILEESGGTFELKGPWFANIDALVTSEPANVQHILVKNFSNYNKGENFQKIFQGVGHSFAVKEGIAWEVQRKAVGKMLNHQNFPKFAANISWKKVVNGLIPVLDHFASSSASVSSVLVDFQDIMKRFTFDTMSMVSFGHDPATLSLCLPEHPCLNAIDVLMEGFFSRHFWPPILWKLQKWLHIGMENEFSDAWEIVYEFFELCISLEGKNLSKTLQTREENKEEEEGSHDILASLSPLIDDIMSCGQLGNNSRKLMRDMLINIFLAGKETQSAILPWLFWLLSRNPCEERKIQQEINANFSKYGGDEDQNNASWGHYISNTEEQKKLIYTRAALHEALRLFPPLGIQHRDAVHETILPSGHRLRAGQRVLLAFYSMGRMESIWGADCLEFKPSRWITVNTEDGREHIKKEPSHKFPAFGAGLLYCLGKDIAFNQMVMIVATIIRRYQIQVADGQENVSIRNSIMVNIKNGLQVRVIKRHV